MVKDCSKCAYEAMILQEFISADKQYLEEKNEEYSVNCFSSEEIKREMESPIIERNKRMAQNQR